MSFSEQPPSKQWAGLKYRGEIVAEIWFKPDGDPFALKLRIPQRSFQIPGIDQQLTTERLLKAVGVAVEQVESWRHEDGSECGTDRSCSELGNPLPPPAQDDAHLNLRVSLKPPPSAVELVENSETPENTEAAVEPVEDGNAPKSAEPAVEPVDSPEMSENADSVVEPVENSKTPENAVSAVEPVENLDVPESPEAKWHYLESRWQAILGAEASLDALRNNIESLQSEMESAAARALNLEEKINAVSADVVLWNRAKSRVRYALPQLREFIHRTTWAAGIPERKKAEEYFTNYIQPRIPIPDVDQVITEFDGLLKSRQILSGQGITAYQKGRSIMADVDRTLRTLQRNAANNAAKKRSAKRERGKGL